MKYKCTCYIHGDWIDENNNEGFCLRCYGWFNKTQEEKELEQK